MEYKPVRIQTPISVTVDDKLLPTSFPSMMKSNQISIPLKDIVKALGAELVISKAKYSDDGLFIPSVYTIKYNQKTASFLMGEPEVDINGTKKSLSSSAYLITGVTMIPASLLKEMGYEVTWDSNRGELSINSKRGI